MSTHGFVSELPPDPSHLIPASFFLRRIEGWTGRWVGATQAFVRGGSFYTHGGIILGEQIIEAEPGGAEIKPASSLWDHTPVLLCDAPMQRWLATSNFPLLLGAKEEMEWAKRTEICHKARYMEGVPYSFLDYVALAAVEFNWRSARWLVDRVEDSQHLICSALVDRAYCWADVHLFDDKPYRWDPTKSRVSGDVTPFDLEQYALRFEMERLMKLSADHGDPR